MAVSLPLQVVLGLCSSKRIRDERQIVDEAGGPRRISPWFRVGWAL